MSIVKDAIVHVHVGFILIQMQICPEKKVVQHSKGPIRPIRWSMVLTLSLIYYILFNTNQSPEFPTLYPQDAVCLCACVYKAMLRAMFTFSKVKNKH